GVFLSVTGLEALYADLGHFGRWPIRTSWLCVVLPSVMFNYLGQGALIMQHPELITNPFYNAGPSWFRWPLIILATMATIIASQAIITGVFSLISQAASLGYSPPLRVIHTNGVTVCSDMLITSILYMCVMRYVWNNHWIRVILFGTFLIFDITFLSANIKLMIMCLGAWVALLIAIIFFILGFSWYYGQTLLRRYLNCYAQTTTLPQLPIRLGFSNVTDKLLDETKHEQLKRSGSLLIDYQTASSDEEDELKTESMIHILPPSLSSTNNNNDENHLPFIDEADENMFLKSPLGNLVFTVTPGLGVFLTTSTRHTPHVFERVLERIHALPQVAIFLKLEYARIPIVDMSHRLKIDKYGSDERPFYHLMARYGYSEHKIHLLDM
ncbi:unnamed protein product, partial [Rotaria sp. Silwood2]